VSNYLTSVLRTVVPALWGSALAWLVAAGILDQAGALAAAPFASAVLVPVAIGAYYALARLVERQPWAPAWLAALLLGAPAAPDYRAGPPSGVGAALAADILSRLFTENRPPTADEAQDLHLLAGGGAR
jgi:hypothetical protein